jgi:putative endonuclease
VRRLALGRDGEDKAVSFLRSKGYRILARNFRTKFGEIDIICRDKDWLVFVEVKTRSNPDFGYPEESVNRRKISRLEKCCHCYLTRNKLQNNYRVEVLSILGRDNPQYRLVSLE